MTTQRYLISIRLRKGVNDMYWVTGLLGFVLVTAPFIFGYSGNDAALWTSIILGFGTIVVSGIEGTQRNKEVWEYWTAGVLGVAAIAAPFLFGFSTHATAMWTTIVTGVLIALFAGSKLLAGDFGKT